jgi:hypothetical protein
MAGKNSAGIPPKDDKQKLVTPAFNFEELLVSAVAAVVVKRSRKRRSVYRRDP